MLNKNDILESILTDIRITKHLLTKVPDGAMDYRPSPDQRSTLELLRYMSFCAIGGAHALYDGEWTKYKEWAERCDSLKPEEIDGALDRHAQALTSWFEGLSSDDFDTRLATTPLGEEFTLGRALIEMPLKWMTAYRMQLFLYAKQSGNKDIWTPNCWGGIDRERPASAATS